MHYGKPWQEPWKVTLIISACNHAMYSDHVANIAIWLWASSSPQLPLLIHARWLCFLGHHQALKVSTIHPLAALQGMEFLHWTSTSQLASYAECGLTTAQFWTDPHVNMSRIEHIGGTLWIWHHPWWWWWYSLKCQPCLKAKFELKSANILSLGLVCMKLCNKCHCRLCIN